MIKISFPILFFLMLLLSCDDEQAAGPGQADTYIKFFGAENSDIAYQSQKTNDGGCILLGTTEVEREGVSAFKIKIVKVDNNGNQVWQKIYPQFESDESDLQTSFIGRSIAVVDDGYIIVGDRIQSDESTASSLLVMKINDSPIEDSPPILAIDYVGYNLGDEDYGLQGIDIIQDMNGNFRVISNVLDDNDDVIGTWFNTINASSFSFDAAVDCFYDFPLELELVKSLHETIAGNFTFGGINKSQANNNSILHEVPSCPKGFSDGSALLVSNPQDDYEASQIIKTHNGYAMIGTRTNAAGSNVFFSLLENNGVPKLGSLKTFDNPTSEGLQGIGDSDEFGLTIAGTLDGGFIMGGYTLSNTAGEEDILLIKTNSFGDIQWTKILGDANQEEATYIQQADDGGYLIFGNTEFGGIDTMVLIKTDKNGNVN